MNRALLIAACFVASLLSGCTGGMPGTEMEIDCIHYSLDADDHEQLPDDIQGVAVTNAVRAQIYTCEDNEWQPIGGLLSVYVNGETAQPNATGGVVVAGSDQPWPYQKESAHAPYQLPLYIAPGISVTVTGTFTALLDPGEMIACWMTDNFGNELAGTRGTGVNNISGPGGRPTSANCVAAIFA